MLLSEIAKIEKFPFVIMKNALYAHNIIERTDYIVLRFLSVNAFETFPLVTNFCSSTRIIFDCEVKYGFDEYENHEVLFNELQTLKVREAFTQTIK